MSFVWAKRPPGVMKQVLYLPLSGGDLGILNFLLYYWAAILVTVHWWFLQPRQNPAVQMEVAILGSYAVLSNLFFRGARAHPSVTVPMKTTIWVWQCARTIYRKSLNVSSHTPLWGNPMLPHLYTIQDPLLWTKRGITTLKHVMVDGKLMPFQKMRYLYSVPSSFKFRY